MAKLKALETKYNGYRFRSRLEARWAVFFDEARIPYEYEKEGFVVDGKPYLPDFYLPWFDCYVEIKPDDELIVQNCEFILIRFSEVNPILLCVGEPYNNRICLYDKSRCFDCEFSEGVWWFDDKNHGLFGVSKHWVNILCKTKEYVEFSGESIVGKHNYCKENNTFSNIAIPRYDFSNEKIKARQARFEHGEKPGRGLK